MKPSHLIFLLLANFFWGGVYSAYKVLGQHLSPGGIVTLRFTLAALCFLPLWPFLRGPAPRGRYLFYACLMGVLHFVLGQRLQVWATQLGTASNSAVLMALEPLLTSVAAAIFLREHLGPRRLAGFALGICGVALLNQAWRPDFHWAGLAPSLIFISSFGCETAYSILGKPIVARASAAKTVAVSLLAGTAVNLLLDGPQAFRAAQTLPLDAWCLLLGLAIICTVVGYTLWLVVIRDCPVNIAALTIFAQSVFGVAIAALWVHEKPHWGHLFGTLAIAAGLILGLSRQIRRPATAEPTQPPPREGERPREP
jgi:drug/metabolite transporter (DMT)-like permease